MQRDGSELNSPRHSKPAGNVEYERGEAQFNGYYALRDALADTVVREVSLAEFLAELNKCGGQPA